MKSLSGFAAAVVAHWYVVAVLAGLMTAGYLNIRRDLDSMRKRLLFTDEYRRRFVDFSNANGFDQAGYDWLTRRISAMERELGNSGRVLYKPPMAGAYINNLPILSDTLPRLRTGSADEEAVHLCDHILNGHAGGLENYLQEHIGDRRNPVRWFVRGVEFLLSVPVLLLVWSGIIAPASAFRLRRGMPFRLISLVAAVITFVSSLVVVVTGWDSFIKQLAKWVGALR